LCVTKLSVSLYVFVKVLDAGAKGVSVAKAPDGKVVFIPNVVPGDVVDVQTFKSASPFTKEKQCISRIFKNIVQNLFVSTLCL
jgi:tRNA/tmRNA/rRNA uracil-C5-methylase (TrmA/RlmC/RlmD family)